MLAEITIFIAGAILGGCAVYIFMRKEIKILESIINDKKGVISSLQNLTELLIKGANRDFQQGKNKVQYRNKKSSKKFSKTQATPRSKASR